MPEIIEEDDNDLGSLLGAGPVPFPESPKREFMPWHRPRKQYVRKYQWNREIEYLIRDLKLDNKEFRYLTLPGSDLLDIRYIHDVNCKPKNVILKYLGFNTAASPADDEQSSLNSAEFSVKKLSGIHGDSEVYPGDIRDIGDKKKLPYSRVQRVGHFHAINFDLCGGFAGKENSGGMPNYFAAVRALLELQRNTTEDFLFFLTTRMDSANITQEASLKLAEMVSQIHDGCEPYRNAIENGWNLHEVDSEWSSRSSHLEGNEHFILGLTQWIISQAVGFHLEPVIKSFMSYRVDTLQGQDDLVSVAIRFRPKPYQEPDPAGLATPVNLPPDVQTTMCRYSGGVPPKVSSRFKVDEILLEEAKIYESCVTESKTLMEASGYGGDDYVDWVNHEVQLHAQPIHAMTGNE